MMPPIINVPDDEAVPAVPAGADAVHEVVGVLGPQDDVQLVPRNVAVDAPGQIHRPAAVHSNIPVLRYDTRYDTRCYFNVRSKADMSQLNLPHGNDN